jgi:predicted histidine transporter YuiF (NhaC family)
VALFVKIFQLKFAEVQMAKHLKIITYLRLPFSFGTVLSNIVKNRLTAGVGGNIHVLNYAMLMRRLYAFSHISFLAGYRR